MEEVGHGSFTAAREGVGRRDKKEKMGYAWQVTWSSFLEAMFSLHEVVEVRRRVYVSNTVIVVRTVPRVPCIAVSPVTHTPDSRHANECDLWRRTSSETTMHSWSPNQPLAPIIGRAAIYSRRQRGLEDSLVRQPHAQSPSR